MTIWKVTIIFHFGKSHYERMRMSLEYLWLLVLALGGTWWVRRDMREYRRFVLLEDTVARRRVYVRWIVQSFTILVGASLGSLWLAGGLWPFDGFPPLFEPAYAALKSTHQAPTRESMLGMALGMTIGVLAIILVQWRRLKRMRGPVHGTADALVPRNHRERAIVVLLSLNAGFSEELFFRLALPLLLYRVTHSLEIALAVSVVCFGLVHAYQGWKGIDRKSVV